MPEITEAQQAEYSAFLGLQMRPADITAKIAKLEKDNQKQREEIREREEKLKALPADGSVVLDAEKAKKWEAYEALGVSPEDAKTGLEERDALKTKDAERDRLDTLAVGGKGEGWGEHAAATLMGLKAFDAVTAVELKEVDGPKDASGRSEKVKVPFFTVDGKSVRASEWVSEAVPHVAPLLVAQGTNGGGKTGGGLPAPEQRGRSAPPGKITEEDVRKSTDRTVDYIL